MIARLAWYAALLAIAVVTAAVQLDRQSAMQPFFAPLTPEPLRGFAQAQLARTAILSGSDQSALDEASKLVERRPIPAESLRALAQAQLKAGKADEALLTIQIAAQRGWRDPAAQEAMLRLAVAAGDEAEAARRYTALFLQNRTEDKLLIEFGDRLFADPKGVAAQTLVGIVAQTDRWGTTFLQRGARVIPADAFAAIAIEADRRGARFDCGALKGVAGNEDLARLSERRCR